MADIKWEAYAETIQTALSTGLNSLADGSGAISSAIDNGTALNTMCDFELAVTFGTAPAGEKVCELYLVYSSDGGTTFSDGSSSIKPASPPDAVFMLRAVTTAQVIVLAGVPIMGPGQFKTLLYNEAGQAFPASGSTLRYRRYNMQSV